MQINIVADKENFPEFVDGEQNIYRFVFEENQLGIVTQE